VKGGAFTKGKGSIKRSQKVGKGKLKKRWGRRGQNRIKAGENGARQEKRETLSKKEKEQRLGKQKKSGSLEGR